MIFSDFKLFFSNLNVVLNANKIPLDANTDSTIDGFDAIIEAAKEISMIMGLGFIIQDWEGF